MKTRREHRGFASVWMTVQEYATLWRNWEATGNNPGWLKAKYWDLWDGEMSELVEAPELSTDAIDLITSWDVSSEQGWNPEPSSFESYDPEEVLQLDFYGDMAQPELAGYFSWA